MNYKKKVARRNRVKGPWALAKGNSNGKFVRTVREMKDNINYKEAIGSL